MRLPLLARFDLYLQRYFFVAFFPSHFWLCYLSPPTPLPPRARKERTFLSALIKKFLGVLMSIPPSGKHTHSQNAFISLRMLLYCVNLLCVVFCFGSTRPSFRKKANFIAARRNTGPDEDEWSWKKIVFHVYIVKSWQFIKVWSHHVAAALFEGQHWNPPALEFQNNRLRCRDGKIWMHKVLEESRSQRALTWK